MTQTVEFAVGVDKKPTSPNRNEGTSRKVGVIGESRLEQWKMYLIQSRASFKEAESSLNSRGNE